uniref:Uncharacterized protein n=1 Tax=Ananas comosus var. bracteatus TaxID=296719 RepID=A0A6V7PXQ5_ANACO|nr:unnamed protein product [Ananas comosus var. bracteatus]
MTDFTPLELGEDLRYEERPVQILARESKELRNRTAVSAEFQQRPSAFWLVCDVGGSDCCEAWFGGVVSAVFPSGFATSSCVGHYTREIVWHRLRIKKHAVSETNNNARFAKDEYCLTYTILVGILKQLSYAHITLLITFCLRLHIHYQRAFV